MAIRSSSHSRWPSPGWSRAPGTPRGRRTAAAVLTEEVVTADELRARAEAALEAGRFEEAVVEGFRAVAVRQVERGRLSDTPGATAHEVAEPSRGSTS